jgi:hypothetical protein
VGFFVGRKKGNHNEQEAENDWDKNKNDNFTSQQRRQAGGPGKAPGDVVPATDGKDTGQKTPVRFGARSNPVDESYEEYRQQKGPKNANYLRESFESYWGRKLDSNPRTRDLLDESHRKAFESVRGGTLQDKPGDVTGDSGHGARTVPEKKGRTADHAIDRKYTRAV